VEESEQRSSGAVEQWSSGAVEESEQSEAAAHCGPRICWCQQRPQSQSAPRASIRSTRRHLGVCRTLRRPLCRHPCRGQQATNVQKCAARCGQHGEHRIDWPEPPRQRERRHRVVQRAHRRFAHIWRPDGHNAAWNTRAKPTSAWSLLVAVRGGCTGLGSGGCESDPDRADASSFMVDANMPPLAGSVPQGVAGASDPKAVRRTV
jgi:hypothetical protein